MLSSRPAGSPDSTRALRPDRAANLTLLCWCDRLGSKACGVGRQQTDRETGNGSGQSCQPSLCRACMDLLLGAKSSNLGPGCHNKSAEHGKSHPTNCVG